MRANLKIMVALKVLPVIAIGSHQAAPEGHVVSGLVSTGPCWLHGPHQRGREGRWTGRRTMHGVQRIRDLHTGQSPCPHNSLDRIILDKVCAITRLLSPAVHLLAHLRIHARTSLKTDLAGLWYPTHALPTHPCGPSDAGSGLSTYFRPSQHADPTQLFTSCSSQDRDTKFGHGPRSIVGSYGRGRLFLQGPPQGTYCRQEGTFHQPWKR